ncbi:MAG TPA: HAMP domain-containing sensor histidine kinase, partial [Steroidobacteraceae bacterium]|nr:HAMP domain-containing sensor histidine kinase [Steroidobacteraceae bacterium]
MNLLRPRSLSALVLLGLAIIALPLVGALVLAGVQMRQLSETSERIIADGVGATRLTRDLFAVSSSLERQVRLYPVLGDRRVIDAYAALDTRLAEIESQLSRELRVAEARASLSQFSELRRGVSAQMMAAPTTPPDYPGMQADFARMEQVAGTLSSQISAYIDTEVSALRARAQRAQQLTFWGFILLIPLTTGAILLFSLRVGRPLGQIDRAISELGSGPLHSPIAVRGPADLERLGRQLEWLRMRLLELAQERNRFLRHMSHELKTPLANIREGTELLMDGAVGELQVAQREVTGILRENGLRLQRMIENLLSYSAWQTSSLGLEISEFRLRPLVKQIIENQQLALLSQRVRLDVNVDDLVVAADRGKVRLILENLLSNAIKYTPRAGTIHIRARASGDTLLLEVGDSGPGISPEERQHVFEAFYTGKAPSG